MEGKAEPLSEPDSSLLPWKSSAPTVTFPQPRLIWVFLFNKSLWMNPYWELCFVYNFSEWKCCWSRAIFAEQSSQDWTEQGLLITGWHEGSGCEIFGFAVIAAAQGDQGGFLCARPSWTRVLSWKRQHLGLMAPAAVIFLVVRSKDVMGTHKTLFFPACKGWGLLGTEQLWGTTPLDRG